ncbi:oxygen-independent coproporphyrinogen III oxidase [Suttonella sp. R2A3]|uniref:oxygen-independent coproporphyrinogen III oxidase n=1 Tax=Suttonella sp. R2A3 TaxID=2908648 RepID=UPI001F47ACDC|nr:oxygen-independent coproporphyrinogen III oxidase [Suttonella sp. R2A3]UJF23903.1 oxygen-independent coproporphyrinogen III oxidase [Suttonella sp. R2A3]
MTAYFDAALIDKYAMSGPRYTSYPTAVQFTDAFGNDEYIAALQASNEEGRDLSLYVHIPFCRHVCYFCACNKIITRNTAQAEEYLRYLRMDIKRQAEHIDRDRKVVQLHFGGGTPTFISKEEQTELLGMLHEQFNFVGDEEGEFSIEIDPRTVDHDYLAHLRSLGFNRVSFGVQDFDPAVQEAVNRVQPLEDVEAVMRSSRELGYHSISVDLIYGLPLQTVDKFRQTLREVIRLSPDRIAVFNYAHMPHLFGAQKQINDGDLPDSDTKLGILRSTIEMLTEAGYEFIGLDHFAKPDDSLVHHQKNGTLYRNFQGYSTFSECDLLGFGVSAISMLKNSYNQHQKARSKYYAELDAGGLPVERGVPLSEDDHIRGYAITEIMCNLKLSLEAVSERFNIDAQAYFAEEWQRLEPFAKDGLIRLDEVGLTVEPIGRLLIRNIAMIFDAYLRELPQKRFSKVI